MKATLTFPNRDLAKLFASSWSRYASLGYDTAKTFEDGSVKVSIYNLDDDDKRWVDSWISSMNQLA